MVIDLPWELVAFINGRVSFEVLVPNVDKRQLMVVKKLSLNQDEFVALLQTGEFISDGEVIDIFKMSSVL